MKKYQSEVSDVVKKKKEIKQRKVEVKKGVNVKELNEKLTQAGFGSRLYKLSTEQKIKLFSQIGGVLSE